MKRWTLMAALLVTLSLSIFVAGQEEVVAVTGQGKDMSRFDYDDFVLAINELAELLDQAIYLAAAGLNPYGGQAQNLHLYGQGIVNLMYGPESLVYDPENPYTVEEGSGIEPLYLSLRVGSFGGLDGYVPQMRSGEVGLAFQTIDSFLSLAGEAARAAAARSVFSLVEPEDLRSAYAYLLAARGGPESIFLVGGVQTLVELFPSREVRVDAEESIQAAIDRVPEGGTLYLSPGTYREAIFISKSLTLAVEEPGVADAFGPVVIQGAPWRSVLHVQSDAPIDVVFRDIVIADGATGMQVSGAASVSLDGVEFRDCGVGLGAAESATASLTGVLFRGCLTGVRTLGHATLVCTNTNFIDGETAVSLFTASDVESVLSDCTIQARAGKWSASVHVQGYQGGLARLLIEDCRIHESKGPGIELWTGAVVRIADTRIEGSLSDGIVLQGDAVLELLGVSIMNSDGYGLVGRTDECFGYSRGDDYVFTGTITGWGNTIPGPDEENGNLEGSICPVEYEFLLDAAPAEPATVPD